ncbi:DUF3828 domain-containing protein [Allosphingosinicella vermicomposti]|uniref:DUF3828 domain-containing protein n=1 Tax=Allosphingosinicella vermicomposti TaxID=614671 RepID=UPI000D101063|nr:DUF3828 domain-containing protein [Allosphingosinicella vermicomposti]
MGKYMKFAAAWLCLIALAAPVQAVPLTAPPAEAPVARGVKDPRAFVQAQYAQYIKASADPAMDVPTVDFAMSPGLFALIERDRAESDGMSPRLDFDYWVNAQEIAVKSVKVAERPKKGGKRIIRATFNNGRPQTIDFYFVAQDGQWALDDVVNAAKTAEERWTLREILSGPRP